LFRIRPSQAGKRLAPLDDMAENQQPVLFNIDLRGTSLVGDCLDGLVALPAAVEQMRATKDDLDLPCAMISGTEVAFQSLDESGDDGLLFVAAAAQDHLYRLIAGLGVMDRYTRAYCALAVRGLFEQLSARDIRTFYILDNTLRDDRFAVLLELFELAGISTTTPRRDGSSWSALSARLCAHLEAVGHVAYIEPDAEVNHLEAAQALARETACVATFRNRSPDEPEYEIVMFKTSSSRKTAGS
jgi:hypothetical protein